MIISYQKATKELGINVLLKTNKFEITGVVVIDQLNVQGGEQRMYNGVVSYKNPTKI